MVKMMLKKQLSIEDGKLNLHAEITQKASKQTYYTIRFLADNDREQDAFRAYAYFRWLDDLLDTDVTSPQEKTALLRQQQAILEACYQGKDAGISYPEELMLVELVRNDSETNSGLKLYLRNMMAVMAFDVERRGRLITQAELTHYSNLLATAVTEFMFYFIGHCDQPPSSVNRYLAVQGAHITHMLRDMLDDIDIGYVNMPAELIAGERISTDVLHSPKIRKWVAERVDLARAYFEAGRTYIARVKSKRCRLAGFAYLARFEWMLKVIEGDHFTLRREYPERKSLKAALWMLWRVFTSWINFPGKAGNTRTPSPLEINLNGDES
jgi:phytoene/squalene synthetase